MDLLLWRHAEAFDAIEGQDDASRELSPNGIKQARRIAKWLDEHGPKHMRVLVSPALRTQQTARIWRKKFETVAELGIDGTPAQLLAASGWPNAAQPVLIVGHQPILGRSASLLLSGIEEDLSIRKGALWWFKLRQRDDEERVILRAVVSADIV